ncbi:hypothetical protein BGZ52_000254, partial [Haplosporangium bisporale]
SDPSCIGHKSFHGNDCWRAGRRGQDGLGFYSRQHLPARVRDHRSHPYLPVDYARPFVAPN